MFKTSSRKQTKLTILEDYCLKVNTKRDYVLFARRQTLFCINLEVVIFAGQNLSNFSLVFWSKRFFQKDILKLTDLQKFPAKQHSQSSPFPPKSFLFQKFLKIQIPLKVEIILKIQITLKIQISLKDPVAGGQNHLQEKSYLDMYFYLSEPIYFEIFYTKHPVVKFIYSETATKCCEISTLDLSMEVDLHDLSYVVTVKSTVEISQNFVAFSEYINFIKLYIFLKSKILLNETKEILKHSQCFVETTSSVFTILHNKFSTITFYRKIILCKFEHFYGCGH